MQLPLGDRDGAVAGDGGVAQLDSGGLRAQIGLGPDEIGDAPAAQGGQPGLDGGEPGDVQGVGDGLQGDGGVSLQKLGDPQQEMDARDHVTAAPQDGRLRRPCRDACHPPRRKWAPAALFLSAAG
ncbi:hypothetical protein GCM10010275_69510 [Streptomyces litmocidini]|nr:hypothetical protein GCM10010275_69510 [Streptomyces litmocidini]